MTHKLAWEWIKKKERENPRATPFKQLSRVQVVIALDKTYRRLTVNSIHI